MEVKIDSKELETLRDSHFKLNCLIQNGVERWIDYEDSLIEYRAHHLKEKMLQEFLSDLDDVLCEAQVDYPAGRETGYHRIEYDEELVLKFLRELAINIQNI